MQVTLEITTGPEHEGKIQVLDPNWWKPMTADEVKDFLAGR